MSARIAIVQALEALEVGDQAGAVDVLLAALDEVAQSRKPLRCPVCHVEAWPEDHARHVYSLHNPSAWRRAA